MSERLTDEELYGIEDLTRAYDVVSLPHRVASLLIAELRTRRAADLRADLTSEDKEALAHVRRVFADANDGEYADKCIALLAKLAGGGA